MPGRKKSRKTRVLGPYERRDGRWEIKVRGPSDVEGRRARTFPTRSKAMKFKHVLEKERVGSADRKVGEAIEEYQEHLRAHGDQAPTVDTVGHRLNPLTRAGVEYVDELTRRHVLARLDGKYTGRVRRPEVATRRGTLKEIWNFFEFARKRGYVADNPCDGLSVDGIKNKGKEILTPREARALVAELEEDSAPAATAVMFAVRLGLRSKEILELRVRALDFPEDGTPTLHVERTTTKTNKSMRILKLPSPLPARLAKLTDGKDLSDWVFPSTRSKSGRRERNWLIKATKRYCRAAGVRRVTPHGLRGTFVTLAMQDGGATIDAASRTLGHENVSTTIGHYSHGSEAQAQAARVERRFAPRGEGGSVPQGGRNDG